MDKKRNKRKINYLVERLLFTVGFEYECEKVGLWLEGMRFSVLVGVGSLEGTRSFSKLSVVFAEGALSDEEEDSPPCSEVCGEGLLSSFSQQTIYIQNTP